jgi:cytochrome c peroxidase
MQWKTEGKSGLRRPGACGRSLLTVLLIAGVLAGCDGSVSDEPDALDERLTAALYTAAPGEGPAFFMLPEPENLAAIPQDPLNVLTPAKVALGRFLFHETALAVNPVQPAGAGTYACASCHHASAGFQAGRIQGIGEGGAGFGQRGEARGHDALYDVTELDVQPLRTPSTLNAAFQEVMFWNGQFGTTGPNAGTELRWAVGTVIETNHLGFHGLETQAISGLVVHRMEDIEQSVATSNETYAMMFNEAFPGETVDPTSTERSSEPTLIPQPIDRRRAGLAIAAYERTILASKAPFQHWLRGRRGAMTDQQKRGALLFFGKAGCVACHTGPALNSTTFHALGMPDLAGPGVFGEVAVDENESLGRGTRTIEGPPPGRSLS